MVSIDAFIVRTKYNELLRQINELKNVDKGFQTKLREIVITLRDISNNLKQIMRERSYEQNETELWNNYQQLQKERSSLLNLSHEWKTVWIPSLHKEFHHLILPIQNAIDELTNHVMVFEDTLRAHIDILEIRSSRENRKVMRKLSFMALLVSVVIPYITLWEGFARDFILNLVFPLGLSPYLNLVILLLSLVPVFWFLIRAWRYLTQE